MKKLIAVVVILVIVILVFFYIKPDKTIVVSNFETCVSAGYPVMESYPRQCKTPNGDTFTEDIGNALEKANLIVLESPRPNELVASPVMLDGKARGNWYFEASFPIEILDANGNRIGMGIAQAQTEWMTTEFVPFNTEITFSNPETNTGSIILNKDNPSGLPEHDDRLVVPVRFR